MSLEMLLGGLGLRELILMAGIVLLMAGVSRLMGTQQPPSTSGDFDGAEEANARRYLDRLLGPAGSRVVPISSRLKRL
jgi:hypothetical protein